MAITYVARIGCPLQERFGRIGFQEMWMIALDRGLADESESQNQGAKSIAEEIDRFKYSMQHNLRSGEVVTERELVDRLGIFTDGLAECITCPANVLQRQTGCCGMVETPLIADVENFLHDFFSRELRSRTSLTTRFYETVIATNHGRENLFQSTRGTGPQQSLVSLRQPLVIKHGSLFKRRRIDTSEILLALFDSITESNRLKQYRPFAVQLLNALRGDYLLSQGDPRGKQFTDYIKHFTMAARTPLLKEWMVDLEGR
ncbi:hypothetical protein JW905_13790 [bacterium]|nr:hypothetical protein [candidate division CSSED10-310 bacterium]